MEDLTKKTFGRLLVLGREKKDGKYLWKCECNCKTKEEGRNIVYVTTSRLKSGNTKSCGCLAIETRRRNGANRKENLTGKRFGRLVVLKSCPEIKTQSPTWECCCDCGKICYVMAQKLKSGSVRSCGCLLEENLKLQGKENWEKILKKKYIDGTIVTFLFDPGKIRENNTHGYPGIEERKRDGKWVAKLTFCGKSYWLGSYYEKYEAILARIQAEDEVIEGFLSHLKESDPEKFLEFENIMKNNPNKDRENIKRECLIEKNRDDLSGKVFDKLTVLEDIGEYRGRNKIWKCRCECENIVFCTTQEIKNKYYISCNEDKMECKQKDDKEEATQGVTWDKSRDKWVSSIYYNHKSYNLCRTNNLDYARYIAKTARQHKESGEFEEWYDRFKNYLGDE